LQHELPWGGVDRRARVTDLLQHVRRDVVGDVRVHGVPGRERRVKPDHRRQDVPLDPDLVNRVLGDVPVRGDHHGDRLADVVDNAVGERVGGFRRVQRRVRDQQWQRFGDPAVEVFVGVDGNQALDVECVADVDVDDAGVRMRAAQERGGQRVMPEVVKVPPIAGG